MSLAGTMRGARFHPVACNRKLSRVVVDKLPPEKWVRAGKHIFDRRPRALRPFVSTTDASIQATCSESCPFKRDEEGNPGGCFADAGFSRVQMKRMDAEAAGLHGFEVILEEAAAINSAFPRGVPQDGARGGRDLRLHVGGDVPNAGAALVLAAAADRWKLRRGGSVWTYTHAWRAIPREAFGNISVLASVETVHQARAARARGYAPAIVVREFPRGKRSFEVGGMRFIPCPAETLGKTCVECRLCLDVDLYGKNTGIAFQVHGKDAAPAALSALKVAGRRVA